MNTAARKALRFSAIRLENWRNFQLAEIELQQRVFLFGANASGKSNFLDVFRFLRDIASPGGGLEPAVQRRGGVKSLRCLAARRYPEIAITVHVLGSEDADEWVYELRFTQDNQQRPTVKREVIRKGAKVLVDRPTGHDKSDPEQTRQTHLEQVLVNQEFRELAHFFQAVEYLHIVPQLVRDPDRYRGQANDPFGWDFLEKISRTTEKTRNARLRKIGEALKIAVPQLKELELTRDARGIPHLRGNYEHWRPQGAWQTEEAFSDGTLRLMGLLWATLDGLGPLLLEEPELSLHPDLVRHIAGMLWRMQRRKH